MATGVRAESVGSAVNTLLPNLLIAVLLAAEGGAILGSGEHLAAGLLGIAVAITHLLIVLSGAEKTKARQ